MVQKKKTIINNDRKIKGEQRDNINFFNVLNEYDEIEIMEPSSNAILFTLTTNWSMVDYNKIYNQFQEKEYPILLDNNDRPIVENNDVVRDKTDNEILRYNEKINKLRIIYLLRLMALYLDLPENDNECIEILNGLGSDIYYLIQTKIQETVIKKQEIKERKKLLSRKLLTFTKPEKVWIDEKRHEMGLQKEHKDGREIGNGITSQFLLVELFKEYGLPYEVFKNALMDNLSKEDEAVVAVLTAHYELRNEQTEKIHKELEDKNKR